MKIQHNIIILCLLGVLSLTTTGCKSEKELSKANPASAVPGTEQPNESPLPEEISATTDQVQTVPVKPVTQAEKPLPTISSASQEDDGYMELEWDSLIPAEYRPETILSKYKEELAELDDNSPRAMELYGKIQAEMDNAPINKNLDGKQVKLAGFIAPLENTDGKVSEFLLVPYFGACIHVPPPPVNQTVLVKTRQGDELKSEETGSPYWIKGTLTIQGEATDIGSAGYSILQAETEEY